MTRAPLSRIATLQYAESGGEIGRLLLDRTNGRRQRALWADDGRDWRGGDALLRSGAWPLPLGGLVHGDAPQATELRNGRSLDLALVLDDPATLATPLVVTKRWVRAPRGRVNAGRMALTLSPPITWSSCRASGAGADGGCHDRGVRVVWSKWPFDCSRRCTTSARPELAKLVSHWEVEGAGHRRLLSLLRGHRVKKLLKRMLDETEFLSDYGVRALSRHHEAQPYVFDLMNGQRMSVGYKPAESDTGLFGGNSNWRGPIWFPVNCLIIESLQMFHHYYGDELRVEWPTGSGQLLSIGEVADEL